MVTFFTGKFSFPVEKGGGLATNSRFPVKEGNGSAKPGRFPVEKDTVSAQNVCGGAYPGAYAVRNLLR